MRDTELFQAALGLSSPWIVLRSEFDPDKKQLDLHIGFARGSRFACPACGAEGCGIHDVRERCYGAGGENSAPSLLSNPRWSAPCPNLSI